MKQNHDKNIYKASRVYCKFYWYKKVKMEKKQNRTVADRDEAHALSAHAYTHIE